MKRNPPKCSQRAKIEVEDYIALVEGTALSFGINHYYDKWAAPRPYSRALHVYGRMALPTPLAGLQMEALLLGDPDLSDMPAKLESSNVAYIKRYGDEVHITASVPVDFISTLSSAFHDGRLHIVNGRGPKLHRGASLLVGLHFEQRAHFEEYWGETISLRHE